MAQLNPIQRNEYNSARESASPSVEQLLRGGEASERLSNSSSELRKENDAEENHGHQDKKSVLTKVKEKAKKLRHTLSGKKKQGGDDSSAYGMRIKPDEPDSKSQLGVKSGNYENLNSIKFDDESFMGLRLDDRENESANKKEFEYEEDKDENKEEVEGEELIDEDPEYLGAPMYESEMAPEVLKESARQHPRAVPVIPETHVLPTLNLQEGADQQEEKSSMPSKTVTEKVTDTLAPAYATMSNATNAVSSATNALASKIHGAILSGEAESTKPAAQETIFDSGEQSRGVDLSVKSLEPEEDEGEFYDVVSDETGEVLPKSSNCVVDQEAASKTMTETVSETLAPVYATVSGATNAVASTIGLTGSSRTEKRRPVAQETKHFCSSEHIPDIGLSEEESQRKTLELGEDVIKRLDAISQERSPKKSNDDSGVVSMVREAVTSLLQTDESIDSSTNVQSAMNSPKNMPISTYAYEDLTPEELLETETQHRSNTLTLEKLPSLTDYTVEEEKERPPSPNLQTCDISLLTKDSLFHQAVPREDDTEVLGVVTQEKLPEISHGSTGVVEKVKDAVTSLLMDRESNEPSVIVQSPNDLQTNAASFSNTYEIVEEEENRGRILQAN